MRMHTYPRQNGFTLIELLVVFSIITILSSVGVAAFVSFGRQQSLDATAEDLKTMLYNARSSALSQVTTKCPSGQQLNGYEVQLCCSGGSCPTCYSGKNYELDAVCAGTQYVVDSRNYPVGVSLDTGASNTTSRSYFFAPLSGGVTGAGEIMLDGYNNKKKTLQVTAAGVVTESPIPSPTPVPTPLPQNTLPTGYANAYNGNENFQGWACQYGPGTYNQVDFYDGPGFVTYIGSTIANINGGDPGLLGVPQCASEDHYFKFPAPNSIKDGRAHAIYGYIIDGYRARNDNIAVGGGPWSYPGN